MAKGKSKPPKANGSVPFTKAEVSETPPTSSSEVNSGGSNWLLRVTVLIGFVAILVALALNLRANEAHAPKAAAATQSAGKKAEVKADKPKLSAAEVKKRAKSLPCKDRHSHEECAVMAARGDCDMGVGWMTVMCAASCNRCELLDPKKRCSEENMGIKLKDAFKPGDLDHMFKTIQDRTSSEIEVLSTQPWMVLVKDFITEEESSTLLRLTKKGLKRSTDQGKINDDGFQEQVVSQHRTSSNSWCMYGCEEHPVVVGLTKRIADLILAPVENFESFQVLQYEKTQKYDVHHDASASDFVMSAGPRVLTFFMYLSDVEEGGETNFPKLNISVKPRKGWALLWPSVESDHPNTKIEKMTYHAALPVKKGLKFAANSWIHLRDYKTPNLWGCTGSFD